MTRKVLCVTDLDGTLVRNSVQIHTDDLAAYQELLTFSDMAIATGRSIKEINYLAENHHLALQYAIGFNGAVVEAKSCPIFSQCLAKDDLSALLDYLKEEQLIFDALDGKERIGNFMHEDQQRVWNMPILCLPSPFEEVRKRTIYKVNIRPNAEKTPFYVAALKQAFPQLEVFQSGTTRIEVTAKGVSKGNSLAFLRNHYDRIVTFGDSGNDVTMFEMSDISYCMNHAPKEVQSLATHVVPSFVAAVEHLKMQLHPS
ncbi:HAD-IIB family hydrolase [Streptococcus pneumoniae]